LFSSQPNHGIALCRLFCGVVSHFNRSPIALFAIIPQYIIHYAGVGVDAGLKSPRFDDESLFSDAMEIACDETHSLCSSFHS